jgi:aminoglycoside 3-N-acetyltransferase
MPSSIYHQEENDLSVRDMGSFPAAVLAMEARVRGNHPLNSFAAIGVRADELTNEQSWEDVYAPLRKLVELDGKLLMMGTDLTSLTFIHYAEQVAGRMPFIRWAVDSSGETRRARIGSCSRAFNNLQLSIEHLRKNASFRQSKCQLLPAGETLNILVEAINNNPNITHCKDNMCLRCSSAVMGGPRG